MYAKHLTAALVLAVAGTSAMAFEATEFTDPVSTASRAGVAAAQAARSQVATAVVTSRGEATQFADVPAARDRAEVRAEARAAGRAHKFNELYAG